MKKINLTVGIILIIGACFIFILNSSFRYLVEASSYLNSGKAAKAVKVLNEALKKFPDNHKITFILAKSYLSLGELEEANKIATSKKLTNALKEKKDFLDFLVDLSDANLRSNNKNLAKRFALNYLTYENQGEVSKRLARNYLVIGQALDERQIELWEKAYNIAHAHKLRELKESLKALLYPKYFQMVEEHRKNKNYEDALSTLKRAAVLGRNAEVNCQEALIYNEIGKIEPAQRLFEEALQLEPDNYYYKILYANALKKAALSTKEFNKRTEYFDKIKLLLSSNKDNPKISKLLNRIIYLNTKYRITNANLQLTMVGEYSYPSIVFKIKPISDSILKKYKVEFIDENKNLLDTYESHVTERDLGQQIEITSRNPINESKFVKVKVFLNDEFVREYSNK